MPVKNNGKLYVRADGGCAVGSGHIMRCLSVADALREMGTDTVFVTADGESRGLIGGRGYRSEALHSDYRNPDKELEGLCRFLTEEGAGLVLADSYFMTEGYISALRGRTRVARMDDTGDRAWDADLVINYNIYADRLPYDRLYPAESRTVLLLGSRFAPLRRAFSHTAYRIREEVRDVLVTTGGADGCRAAGRIAELISEFRTPSGEKIRCHVISGPFHAQREELYRMAEKDGSLIIHENVTRMAELMASCDLAVSAAGSTLYELCAVGVPSVYFYFVENQRLPAAYFERDTRMINVGNFAAEPEKSLAGIEEALKRLCASREMRVQVSESMRRVSDGRGAERIAECLKRLLE